MSSLIRSLPNYVGRYRHMNTLFMRFRPRSTTAATACYHERVVDHFKNPRNVGTLDPADPHTGTATVGAPACGDVIRLSIRVDPDTRTIVDTKFKAFGCGSAIASSSTATEMIRGLRVDDEVDRVTNRTIASYLNLPPVKMHCSMLAQDAIQLAKKDWAAKQQITTRSTGCCNSNNSSSSHNSGSSTPTKVR